MTGYARTKCETRLTDRRDTIDMGGEEHNDGERCGVCGMRRKEEEFTRRVSERRAFQPMLKSLRNLSKSSRRTSTTLASK